MKIGICPSSKKTLDKKSIEHIISSLRSHQIDVFIDEEAGEYFSLPIINEEEKIDIYMSLGGDGTLLYYISKYNHIEDSKFTAINFGHLGFMADIQMEEFDNYIEDIKNGKWRVDERIVLECITPDKLHKNSVNDVVFHRSNIKNMVHLEVSINNQYFNTFQADGLIISTPTGSSTAYSLSSGGPIVHPSLKAFVITPICPHTLTNRPFVIPDSSVIKVKSINKDDPVTVTIDGVSSFTLSNKDETTICLSTKTFKLISFHEKGNTFYSTLRTKLGWKGSY